MKRALVTALALVVLVGLMLAATARKTLVLQIEQHEGCEEETRVAKLTELRPSAVTADDAPAPAVALDPPPERARESRAPELIETVPCRQGGRCDVYRLDLDFPARVTVLSGGPWGVLFEKHAVRTGTSLDEAQRHLTENGLPGVAISLDEDSPRCLSVGITSVEERLRFGGTGTE